MKKILLSIFGLALATTAYAANEDLHLTLVFAKGEGAQARKVNVVTSAGHMTESGCYADHRLFESTLYVDGLEVQGMSSFVLESQRAEEKYNCVEERYYLSDSRRVEILQYQVSIDKEGNYLPAEPFVSEIHFD